MPYFFLQWGWGKKGIRANRTNRKAHIISDLRKPDITYFWKNSRSMKRERGLNMTHKRDDRKRTIKEIIDEQAGIIMTEKGAEFTIREICNASGISIGTFYNYYRNKDELILQRPSFLNKCLEEVAEKNKDRSADEQLIALAEAHMEYVKTRGKKSCADVYRCMLALPTQIDKETNGFFLSFQAALCKGVEEGLFTLPGSPDDCAMMMVMLCRGIGFSWCCDDSPGEDRLREGIEACRSMVRSFMKKAEIKNKQNV